MKSWGSYRSLRRGGAFAKMPDNTPKADTAILHWQSQPFGPRMNVTYAVTTGMKVNIANDGAGRVGPMKSNFGTVKQ